MRPDDEFAQLADQGYNRVPVVFEVLADLDTPLSAYLKLAKGGYSYLLESAQGGEQWGRYSIIGLPCRTLIRVQGRRVTLTTDGEVSEDLESEDPLAFVEQFLARYKVAQLPGLTRFNGGLVGYFGYDCARYGEPRLQDGVPPDDIGAPDAALMLSEEVLIFDNLKGRLLLISLVDPTVPGIRRETLRKLAERAERLKAAAPSTKRPGGRRGRRPIMRESDFVSQFGAEPFKAAVRRIREYALAGDVMQVVLSQRMSAPFEDDPIDLYRALRSLNPSPYMYFMDFDDFQIVSSSPEIMARLDHGTIHSRPLAGTRRRGRTLEEDQSLEQNLLEDPKEVAEHLMLIDLARNDIGRVAQFGSVQVPEQFAIERYSHVMHISSSVTGQIQAGKTAMDLLRATLPVGTLSGAPKIRAMQIIDQLEPVKRGIYGGAVGYLAWNGNMDTAIAIRTALVKDRTLHIQAGGGILADSKPDLEWMESLNKGRAIFRAATMASSRFKRLN